MKKILLFFIFIAGSIFLLSFKSSDGTYLISYSYCDTPISYRLGFVDPRFKLSDQTVTSYSNEAASLWNSAYGQPLFIYDPEGEVTINFSYDERQELNEAVNSLEQQLDQNKSTLDPQVEAFQKRSSSFEQRLAVLNEKIRYWNNQGGAPQDTYNELEKERQELQQEADALNRLAVDLNQSTRAYNSQVSELNATMDDLKKTLQIRPEEGVYNSADNSITIYFNNTKDELIHTLAHELGHARGIDHNPNPVSVMYANSTEVVTLSSEDKAALQEICQKRSYIHYLMEKYIEFAHSLRMIITDR